MKNLDKQSGAKELHQQNERDGKIISIIENMIEEADTLSKNKCLPQNISNVDIKEAWDTGYYEKIKLRIKGIKE